MSADPRDAEIARLRAEIDCGRRGDEQCLTARTAHCWYHALAGAKEGASEHWQARRRAEAERDVLAERVRVLEATLAEEQRQYDRLQAKFDGQDPGCLGCTRREVERDEARERVRVLECERTQTKAALVQVADRMWWVNFADVWLCIGTFADMAALTIERDRAQEEAATLRVALAAAEERAAYFCSDRNREGMRAEGIERERDALGARLEELTGEKMRERIRDCLNERTAISVGSPEWGPDKAADAIMSLLRKEGSR